jgi:hypothetical protein
LPKTAKFGATPRSRFKLAGMRLDDGGIVYIQCSRCHGIRRRSNARCQRRWLGAQVSGQLRRDGSEPMYLLDSTSITLKGRKFDEWTLNNCTRHTQGIMVHVLLDAQSQTPQ